MDTDLDATYKAMKKPRSAVDLSGEVERFRNEACEAIAKYFAAVLHERAKEEGSDYERLYNERAPRAMVLITTSIQVVRNLASGESEAALDSFLDGVVNGKA